PYAVDRRVLHSFPTRRSSDLSDLRAFRSLGFLAPRPIRIVLSGQPNLQLAWRQMLKKDYDVKVVSPEVRALAFLAGLREIVFASSAYRQFQAGIAGIRD